MYACIFIYWFSLGRTVNQSYFIKTKITSTFSLLTDYAILCFLLNAASLAGMRLREGDVVVWLNNRIG